MAVNFQNKQQDNQKDLQDKSSRMSNNQAISKHASEPDMSKDVPLRIAIIGGGLTGLMTASLLEKKLCQTGQSIAITVFEKSAGVGRLATRYKQKDDSGLMWQFDFGAQFFTAKYEAFKQYLQPWRDAKVIEPWLARTAQVDLAVDSTIKNIELIGQWTDNQPRYISTPKMTSFGRAIAQSLKHTTLKYRTRVAPLADNDTNGDPHNTSNTTMTATGLLDEQGNQLGCFDWVVCTAPQAQAIELMAESSFEHKKAIETPEMLACYSLMLGWGSKESLPESLQSAKWDVLEVCSDAESSQPSNHNPLGSVFIEHHKPGREHLLPSLTIHSDNRWAQQHVDDDIEDVKQQMVVSAKVLLGWDEKSAPLHIDCHRWRYASTPMSDMSKDAADNGMGQCAYVDFNRQWIVTGDWCGEGRIESCFKAANDVASAIISHHS